MPISVWLTAIFIGTIAFAQKPLLREPEPKLKERKGGAALEQAQRFAEKGDWEAALREFEKAVKQAPNNVNARMGLAEALLQLDKLDEALPHLHWLSQKEPNNPRIWSTLGQVREQKGQLKEAAKALRKAVHLQPEEPEFRVHLSRVLIALERWDEAAHHLRWLAKRFPDLASVQYHLALVYERKGKIAKALQYAKRTVQLSPKEPDARLLLARLSLQLNDFRTAAEQMEALTKQFPRDVKLAMECGKLFAQANEVERAIRYFRSALHLQPDLVDAHRALADLYSQRNEWEKALWHVRWLVKRFPDDPQIAQAEAQSYVRLKRYRDAEIALQRWSKSHPERFEPFVHLARLYRELGDTAKSRMSYDEALKHRPPVEVIAEAADLEEHLGDFERAAKLYEWAQRREPDKPQWRALRVEALMFARQFDRAGRILRFALKRFPQDQRLNTLMGLWHAKRVEWVEAEPFLRKGIVGWEAERMATKSERKKPIPIPHSPIPDLQAIGTLVEIWLCQGREKEAVKLCETLLQNRPSPEVLIWWAQAMSELGKTKEAAQRLERSQAFAKGNEQVAKVAARLWELANEPAKAVSVWEHFATLQKEPQRKIGALLQATQVWERANEIPKALAVLEKAIRTAPYEFLPQAERIRLMLRAKAFAAALEDATKLLMQHPAEPQAAILYAEAALGLWKDAALERVMERFAKDKKFAGALVLIAEQLNRLPEAEKALQQSLQSAKNETERYALKQWLFHCKRQRPIDKRQVAIRSDFEQAQRLAEQGQIEKALFFCRKVIAVSPDFLPAYELLVRLYQQRKDLVHVIKAFTQMANRDRDNLPLNFGAGMACSLDGQHRRAITYWRRVCALTGNEPDAMLKLAESLQMAREEVQASWVRKFLKRLERWEGFNDASH